MPSQADARIKRLILGRPQNVRVFFPRGFLDPCRGELEEILSDSCFPEKFKPAIEADQDGLRVQNLSYRHLLELTLRMRTARDILWQLGKGRVGSVKEIQKLFSKIPWDLILPENPTVALRVDVQQSYFKHEGKLAELFLESLRPLGAREGSKQDCDFLFDIRLLSNQLEVTVSLSGRPLYERSYKPYLRAVASIKEDLAASIIRKTLAYAFPGSPPEKLLIPFAGSGTLGFECLLNLLPVSASAFPRRFSISEFVCTPAASCKHVERCLKAKLEKRQGEVPQTVFIETSEETALGLERNCSAFALAVNLSPKVFQVRQADFFDHDHWPGGDLLLALNPPYGRRLKTVESPEKLYSQIGSQVALQQRSGSRVGGFLLAPHLGAERAFSGQLKTFETESCSVLHGGKTIRLLLFRSKK